MDIDRIDGAERLVIAAHDAVVMLAVAVCLDLDEAALMEFARPTPSPTPP